MPTSRDVRIDRACYAFSNMDLFDLALEYTLDPDHKYIRRRLSLTKINVPLTLLKIELGRTAFQHPRREFIKYDTFWNAPTVSFLRWEKGGLFTGIENPFFDAAFVSGTVALSFDPSLIIQPGETYESEAQFIGV